MLVGFGYKDELKYRKHKRASSYLEANIWALVANSAQYSDFMLATSTFVLSILAFLPERLAELPRLCPGQEEECLFLPPSQSDL